LLAAVLASALIYEGASQFVLVSLLTAGALTYGLVRAGLGG
jgi:predicted branched-subunit amino acid permease